MFTCNATGGEMSDEVIQASGYFIRYYNATNINIYGGEPFKNIELFDKVFTEVYESQRGFFVSSNGSFMTDRKKREYVFNILRKIRHNEIPECTGIRISNDVFHRECQSKELYNALGDLKYMIDDPYEFYSVYNIPEDSIIESPFYHEHKFIYIERDSHGDHWVNPSGRALKNGLYDKNNHALCSMTYDFKYGSEEEIKDYADNDLSVQIKVNGDIQVCSFCDGCSVGNILEPGISPQLIVKRIMELQSIFKESYDIHEDVTKRYLCPRCKAHRYENGHFVKRRWKN